MKMTDKIINVFFMSLIGVFTIGIFSVIIGAAAIIIHDTLALWGVV
jgi:hypothetical protein